ncbi:DUF1127 domain-containing protein [Microvirga sp. 17 mud 1-3]|uniref:DUF1127 domain-containing protein n=1 Tax=Microvirga sp. 17 mud 1-3 TaxID=2082949 RepID=UPI0013A56EC6|nr:DUF1127 domain-containing protein [Microvirga sp. 17 mud 1-3]
MSSTLAPLSVPFAGNGTSRTSRPSLLARLAAALVREIRIRRDMRALSGFGDAALHDIGLVRGSVEDAVRHGRPSLGRSRIVEPALSEEVSSLPLSLTEWR